MHLAACHRVLRNQDFGPGMSSHFTLFCLVSSGRDRGDGRTEAALLELHLGYWLAVLDSMLAEQAPTIATPSSTIPW